MGYDPSSKADRCGTALPHPLQADLFMVLKARAVGALETAGESMKFVATPWVGQ